MGRNISIKRIARYGAYSAGGLVALVVVLAAAATVRLAIAPISLSFLAPSLTESISERLYYAYEVNFDDIRLKWSDGRGRLGLELVAVRVADYSGEDIAAVPSIALGLPPGRLISGDFRPEAITVKGPKIRWIKTAGGAIKFDIGADEPGLSGKILEDFLIMIVTAPEPTDQQEPLPEMRIVDAEIMIGNELQNSEILITDADILIGPDPAGVRTSFEFTIATGATPARVSAEGVYHTANQHISLDVDIHELAISQFAGEEWLALTNLFFEEAVTGRASFEMDKFFSIEAVNFDLRSPSGSLTGEATAEVRMVELSVTGKMAHAPEVWPPLLGPAIPAWAAQRNEPAMPLSLALSGTFDKFDKVLHLDGHLAPPETPISVSGTIDQPVLALATSSGQ